MSENDPTPLEFLQAIYTNEGVPLPVRMRAAIEAAPYCHPKLQVSASLDGRGFAEHMKQLARDRYGTGNVIDAKPLSQPADGGVTNPERAGDVG